MVKVLCFNKGLTDSQNLICKVTLAVWIMTLLLELVGHPHLGSEPTTGTSRPLDVVTYGLRVREVCSGIWNYCNGFLALESKLVTY